MAIPRIVEPRNSPQRVAAPAQSIKPIAVNRRARMPYKPRSRPDLTSRTPLPTSARPGQPPLRSRGTLRRGSAPTNRGAGGRRSACRGAR